MAPVTPHPDRIRGFPDAAAFEAWLGVHHDTTPELWLRIGKKGHGPTVSYADALDIALCWGWIDGQKKPLDATAFLQRFTPRGAKSIWSQRNIGHIQRLRGEGRMQPAGEAQVAAAQADGRWQRAYPAGGAMDIPDDLAAAIAANAAAQRTLETLNRQNRFALAFRIHNLKTPAGRDRKITGFVEMLARGETIYPNGAGSRKAKP